MCGRYRLTTTPLELARRFSSFVDDALLQHAPRFNVAPTDVMPVLRLVDDVRWLLPHRWGLVPPWAKDLAIGSSMINARAETAFVKPAFKAALKTHRCLVVVDGVYEWQTLSAKQKRPHLITFNDAQPVTLAGLWSTWRGGVGPVHTFTILTTAANEQLRALHDRMPIVVDEGERDAWLDPSREVIDLQHFARQRELPGLRVRGVSSRLGNVRHDDATLDAADEEPIVVAPRARTALKKKQAQADLFSTPSAAPDDDERAE
jgi:putative SOS response-associated peptidase YedK